MADSAWQQYVDQVVHKLNYDTNEWQVTNMCAEAAIYGQDGSAWAWTPGFPDLQVKDFTIQGMTDADTRVVKVDQFACLKGAADNNRNPSEAGIVFGEDKYMLINQDKGCSMLTGKKGGASVMKTTTAIVVAIWHKDKMRSDNKMQNGADCADQVSNMANYLIEQGY